MGNLMEIQSQIEKLQKQASDIRAKEFDKTVQDILAQMQAFGITLKDLQQASSKVRVRRLKVSPKVSGKKLAGKKRSAKGKAVVAVKYHGPKGETWSGRGSMPRWMSALVTKGRKKEEFAIKA